MQRHPARRGVVRAAFADLQADLAGELLRLAGVLGRDLSHWLGGIRPEDRKLDKAA